MTGRPTAFDATAACTTKSGTYLRPKLPPRNVVLTITFSAGMPNSDDSVQRTLSCPWIGPHTSISSARTCTVALTGSIVAWTMYGVW